MPHAFGNLQFPFAAPASGEALTDPCLDVLASFFSTLLQAWAGTAWIAAFPGETCVRSVRKYDPYAGDFISSDLPALYLWRDDSKGDKTTDQRAQRVTTLNVGWMPHPRSNPEDTRNRTAFFNGFEKAIARAVEQQRDPAWVVPGDTPTATVVAYGSSVRKWAGFSSWSLGKVERWALAIRAENGKEMAYQGCLAEIEMTEMSLTDVSEFGVTPFGPAPLTQAQLDFILTTGGTDPLTLQHEREPDT